EAYRLGALESVVPRDRLAGEARELAAKIASKSGKALRLAKESLDGIELLDVKRSYRFEQGFTLELYTSPDSQEARDAFVEKRDADFAAKKK
ncbi:MAG: enoyl-CoA hydratase-related protein, partial [Candidatus Binatia bacterium]